MNATHAYSLSRKYVDETLVGMGALKGAPCEVASIVSNNGITTITLQWTDTAGTVHIDNFDVKDGKDGTPIYSWESGHAYKVGDLAIFSNQFYLCTTDNSDTVFNPAHWSGIGSSDGKYDIVNATTDLPMSFGPTDRKMYFVISEGLFYLWDGTAWVSQQEKSITNAEIDALFV